MRNAPRHDRIAPHTDLLAALALAAAGALAACGSTPPSGTTTAPPPPPPERATGETATSTDDPPARDTPVAQDSDTCDRLAAVALGPPQALLAGRLTVRTLHGAQDAPVPWSVMGAPDAPEDRSRAYFSEDDDQLALAIAASERYTRPGPRFEEAARAVFADAEPGTISTAVPQGLAGARVVAWTPNEPTQTGRSTYLLDAFVALPDDTVVRIEIQTYAGGVRRFDRCVALAQQLFGTLALGPRRLETGAGTRTFADGAQRYTVDVPAEWTVVTQPGPDFTTVYVRRLVPMGEVPPRLILTFGADESEVDATPGARTAGRFLGRAVQWTRYAGRSGDPNRQVLVARTEASVGRRRVEVSAQTFVAEAREEMVRIAESVRAAR